MLGTGASNSKAICPCKKPADKSTAYTAYCHARPLAEVQSFAKLAKLSEWHDNLQYRLGACSRHLIWSVCLCPQRKGNLSLQILGKRSACIQQKATGLIHTHAGNSIKVGAITFKHQRLHCTESKQSHSWHQLHHSTCYLNYNICSK